MQGRLVRTNFLNGMKFNPDLLAVSDKYYENKISILSLGGIGYGAYYIYNDTMQRMAVLRDNNAKLEVALDSKDAVINELQNNMKKQIELSNEHLKTKWLTVTSSFQI